jgi:arylsulfatase A-like enzyme
MTARLLLLAPLWFTAALTAADRPNLILVMADDMGWGQTSDRGHPFLKTPNLDAMAANGLRFERFYAGAPNCSPTRATVMTGRTNDRTGVQDHGYPMRLQERTIAQALRDAGYATGHFGKWHLNGFSGPGAPVLKEDERNPGAFGFETWLSATNFFDRDPLLGSPGGIREFQGDSSEIIVDEALKFIDQSTKSEKPFFTVIWYGSPHSPFAASETDRAPFAGRPGASQDHHGELVAMDRSIGTLRAGLSELGLAENTLVWFNSDNGGIPEFRPESVGGLRGNKGTVYEGGLRVPGIIEWPDRIAKPRITTFPAGTVDIFPTLAAVAGLPETALPAVRDGMNLVPLFAADPSSRPHPLGFRHRGRAAWIDGSMKLVTQDLEKGVFELYDLGKDPDETTNLAATQPDELALLVTAFMKWNNGVEASVAGKDYPEGKVTDTVTRRRSWPEEDLYRPFFEAWKDRTEFRRYLGAGGKRKAE